MKKHILLTLLLGLGGCRALERMGIGEPFTMTIINNCVGSWAKVVDGKEDRTLLQRLLYGQDTVVALRGHTNSESFTLTATMRSLADNHVVGVARVRVQTPDYGTYTTDIEPWVIEWANTTDWEKGGCRSS